MLNDPTLEKLRALSLTGMAQAWLAQQQRADLAALAFDERFGLLVDAEYLMRENRRLERRLREAKLRHTQACLEDVTEPAKRGLDRALLRQLGTCRWIAEHLNVVITGATGVGKTYLACALGQHACRNGYRVLYRRTPRLIDELTLARADGTLPRLLARLARLDVLILDDWGITPLRDHDRRDLLEVIEDRDGTRSTLLASQIPIAKWHDYLGDPTVADAIADRLLHNAHRLVLKGPSRRKRQTREANTED
jgi:DNA replication protein DnaC